MLDWGLAAVLVLLLPAYMLRRSVVQRGHPPEPRLRRYLRSILIALVLDGTLLLVWLRGERAVSGLGLGAPVSGTAVAGLGLGLLILIGLGIVMILRPRPTTASGQDDPSFEIMPQTQTELILFVAFALTVGCSWEVLYRGFLLWLLPAHLGVPASVLIAALAYGLAHGFRNAKMLAASLISALVVTSAFAATRSLWWLMLVHCGLPLLGVIAFYRQRRIESADVHPAVSISGPSVP